MTPFEQGSWNCELDFCENSAFCSVGGVDARQTGWVRPSWVSEENFAEYVKGYEDAARRMFGENWRTVPFGWAPAITINGPKEEGEAT